MVRFHGIRVKTIADSCKSLKRAVIAEQKISLFCVLKQECHCQRENVSCSGGGLDIIPITLNPMMKRLSLRDNNIRVVDASLNFYTQVSRPLYKLNYFPAYERFIEERVN